MSSEPSAASSFSAAALQTTIASCLSTPTTAAGTPASAAYTGFFEFTGSIQRVVINLGDDDLKTLLLRKDKTRD